MTCLLYLSACILASLCVCVCYVSKHVAGCAAMTPYACVCLILCVR